MEFQPRNEERKCELQVSFIRPNASERLSSLVTLADSGRCQDARDLLLSRCQSSRLVPELTVQ